MKRDGSENKKLWLILVGLGGVIVVLVIVIAIVVATNHARSENTVVFDESEGAVDCSDVNKLEDNGQIANCLGRDYRNGNEEKAISKYKSLIDEAFNNGDEERFQDLLSSLAYLYLGVEQCDKAMSTLEDNRAAGLSAEARAMFYSEAGDVFIECGNEKKAEEYANLVEEIWESDEIELPPYEDDGENNDMMAEGID